MADRYDYVVVGAGSAGCAAAARLSADGDATVAVVEAGPPATGPLFDIPRLFGFQLKTSFDWDFTSEPEAGLGGRRTYLPRGRAIGGTSSMNTQLYVRGNRADYDGWRDDLGLEGWGYEDVLPVFMRQEDNERGADEFHGSGGPLRVSDARSVDPLISSWLAAAQEAGHLHNPDFNGAVQDGVGVYQLTQRDGRRWSSAKAFLEPASDRPNLTVLPLTHALRIVWDGDRAAGLEVDHGGEVRTIGIDGELVVCAGAYLSPQLLLISGVGPADELRAVGVQPFLDLPDVGRGLRDHPGCFISLRAHGEPPADLYSTANQDLLLNEGIGPLTWTEAGGFLRSSPELDRPDLQFHAALGLVQEEGLSSGQDHGLGFGPYVCRPQSAGSIRLRSNVPYAKPRIHHNFFADPHDRELLRRGLRLAMEMARQPALGEGLETLESAAAAGLAPTGDTDDVLDAFITENAFSFYHPSGTCAMGRVVDQRLRVHGLANVRVADTSVMPTELTGNLNAPAIMIGERAGDFVAADHRESLSADRVPATTTEES